MAMMYENMDMAAFQQPACAQVWDAAPMQMQLPMQMQMQLQMPIQMQMQQAADGCMYVMVPMAAVPCAMWAPAADAGAQQCGFQALPAAATAAPAAEPRDGLSAEAVASLRQQFASGPAGVEETLRQLQQPALLQALAFDAAGCRLVQDALEAANNEELEVLASAFRGLVLPLVMSPHGNYVLQKLISTASMEQVAFIAEELHESGSWLPNHAYGCRIFCRLLEQAASQPAVVRLTDVALAGVEKCTVNSFGHHIVERVLEYGSAEQRSFVVERLCRDIVRFSRDKCGSYVVEKALLHCSFVEQEALARAFLAVPAAELAKLARFHLGCMVLRALRKLPRALALQLEEHLGRDAAQRQFASTRRGRAFLQPPGGGSESASTRCETASQASAEAPEDC